MRFVIYILVAIVLSFSVFFAFSFLGSYSLNYKLALGSVFYFFLTYYSLKYFTFCKPFILLLLISYPLILFYFIINILDFKQAWISFPSSTFLILGCLSGYFFSTQKNYLIPIGLFLSVFAWFQFGEKRFSNKMQYGSFDQTVLFKTPDCVLYDTTFKRVSIQSSNKILLLDFWNSSCGPCYRLFPVIDSVNKLLDTTQFKIFSVNVPLNGEVMKNNFKLLNDFNYSFSKLYSQDKSILDSFKIEVYPTTIIISNNNVIFRGEFLNAIKKLKS